MHHPVRLDAASGVVAVVVGVAAPKNVVVTAKTSEQTDGHPEDIAAVVAYLPARTPVG